MVFITGDIHTLIAGDVRIADNDTTPVATEFVGGSITSPGLGEGGGGVLPGANPRKPNTPQGIYDILKKENPWVKDADLDHHGYGLVEAGPSGPAVQVPPCARRARPARARSCPRGRSTTAWRAARSRSSDPTIQRVAPRRES